MRASNWLLALALWIPLASACADHREEIAALEAERDAWLAKSVAKEDYWKQVERKGTALRELRTIKPAFPEFEQRTAEAQSMVQAVAPRVAEADEINGRLSEQLGQLRQQVTQLRDDAAKLEEFVGPGAGPRGDP